MWRYLEELRETLADLGAQRVRAFLTLLGIILGVGTLVFLSSLVAGAEAFLKHGVQRASGSDLVSVVPEWDPDADQMRVIDRHDARALARATAPEGAIVLGRYVKAVNFGDRWGQRVFAVGSQPESLAMYGLTVAQGRFLAQADVWAQSNVAVLGAKAVAELLPRGVEPLGEEVKLKGHRFTVVGVLAPKPSQNKGNNWKWDTSVLVPEPVWRQRFASSQKVDEIVVKLPPGSTLDGAAGMLVRRIEAVMGLRHRGAKDFRVNDPSKESREGEVIGLIVIGLELAIAGVCLGVGGINIMNILMVTVAQRRREIGIRRSMGATKGSIQRQFLVEAGALAAIGGLLGIGVGNLAAWLASLLFTQLMGYWPFVAAPLQMALGFSAAVGTGLVFGWYPARQAAELKPIDCLRAD